MTAGFQVKKHGMTGTPEHRIWAGMRKRCFTQSYKEYHLYGGRGITICERWAEFENFFADMGLRPSTSHSLDRIDSDGNYEPSNCRWATDREQSNNTSRNVWVSFNGSRYSVAQLSRATGVSQYTIHSWLKVQKLTEKQITEKLIARERPDLNKSAGFTAGDT